MDIMDIMEIRDIMEIMDIMDIMDIMGMMDIMIITAWMAMAGAVLALVLKQPLASPGSAKISPHQRDSGPLTEAANLIQHSYL